MVNKKGFMREEKTKDTLDTVFLDSFGLTFGWGEVN